MKKAREELLPGYVSWARESMSDSLRAVDSRWSLPDSFVLEAFMTSGKRSLLRADAIIALYESRC